MLLLVKVEYPLKQGLKLLSQVKIQVCQGQVKVEYPLKQGLKQNAVNAEWIYLK